MKRVRPLVVLTAFAALGAATFAVGCHSSGDNDTPAVVTPRALGSGDSIAEIANPTLPNHQTTVALGPTSVEITGISYSWLDTYDETANGKSIGDIYFQDFCAAPPCPPYSGMSAYEQTFEPANTVPQQGDVFDFIAGTYEESTSVGSAIFTPPGVLIQVSKPIITYRFQAPELIQPTPINVNDLEAWGTGRQWTSMLVTVSNITFPDNLANSSGRVTIHLTSDATDDGVVLSNAFFDVATWNAQSNVLGAGKTVKSITGIVTWFYNFQIAPRSPADIVQ